MSARRSLNKQQFPSALYHVTTDAALDSIREHGIDNTKATDGPWDNVDDWDDGAYLWDSPKRAEEYATSLAEMGHRPHVLEVDPSGLDLTPDETGSAPVVGAWHASRVPPDRVRWS